MTRIYTIALFVALSYPSIAQKSDALNWIVGAWKINTGKALIIETWKQVNDSTFLGNSVFVKAANDTTLQETLQLVSRKGEWYYISTFEGQNNNEPVSFQLIFIGRSEFISSNAMHDFPQRIAYRRINNQLFASIEGSTKGGYRKKNFDFTSN